MKVVNPQSFGRAVVIIPARYDSTRLPGKLVHPETKRVTGKFIIEHVYERVKESPLIERVIVATDDERISDVVKGFGGNVEMTSRSHKSGTDRIAEVAAHLDVADPTSSGREDIVVNVQGDEPEIRSEMIDALISAISNDDEVVMATLANEIKTVDELFDPNVVKVVLDNDGYALYFSRAPIPYVRDAKDPLKDSPFPLLKHIGVYAYRRDFLLKYVKLPHSPLEETERLEQLRALSNGYRIRVCITPFECMGIDTQEDLKRFLNKNTIIK